ncbi:MAG TPA: hypothetical protein VGH64_15905 [Puia sp.]|jgi:hypothetical protein
MKQIFLFASVSVACGLLFANLYSSLIDARSWGADLPNSMAVARAYFKTVNPGNFFRMFSPLNQALGIIVLILFWKTSHSVRLCLGIALAMYLLAEGLTFGFFFPRNDIMFRNARLTDIDLLKKTWMEWTAMNWIRSGILLTGIFFSFLSVHKIYATRQKTTAI